MKKFLAPLQNPFKQIDSSGNFSGNGSVNSSEKGIFGPVSTMLKRIIILVVASCFFLENIVVYIVIRNKEACYVTDSDESGSEESQDIAKKDKKEDFNVSAHYKYFFVSDALNNNFHFFDEQTYHEYCPEINLPPPDAA